MSIKLFEKTAADWQALEGFPLLPGPAFRFWHRVISARTPWMAARNTPRSQPESHQRASFFNGFYCVAGTSGRKATASTNPGTKKIPVEPDGGDEQRLDHCMARFSRTSISPRTRILSSVSVNGPTLECRRKTRSRAGSSCRFCRKASRMTRLMAFRVTDFAAKRLAMTRPSRAQSMPASAGALRGVVTTNNAPLARRLPLRADAYSEGRCRRAAAGNVARIKASASRSYRLGAASFFGLYGQTLAAFCTARIDNGTAATRFHADAKTMGALATGDGRLEGAFHWRSKIKELLETLTKFICSTGFER